MTEPVTALQEWVSNDTPSGIKVEYRADPRTYRVDGKEVPSVTTVTDVMPKSLSAWAMKVGMVGILQLLERGLITEEFIEVTLDDLKDRNHPLLQLMKANGLTANQRRDSAGNRGTSIHQALEDWGRTGWKPFAENFPPHEAGYVDAINAFLDAVQPEPVFVELMVGSKSHGFAGRFDLLARTEEMEIQTGPRTKRKVPAGLGLLDLKTSSGVFDSHKYQLSGYRIALEECGYPRSTYEAVIHAKPDGRFDFIVSDKKPHHFLAAKTMYDALKGPK